MIMNLFIHDEHIKLNNADYDHNLKTTEPTIFTRTMVKYFEIAISIQKWEQVKFFEIMRREAAIIFVL